NEIIDIVNELDRKGIYVLCRCNTRFYPEKLHTLGSPFCLYTMGNLELLNSRYKISVVGSRQPSKYGKNTTEKMTRELTRNGFVIISGLAYGVDCIAHSVCLQEGGFTIAVLGSGFDHVYPSAHTDLFNKIVKSNGLVVSEYKPSIKPVGYHFPNRNRVIVGISNGVLITEATEKSGTMYTKDFAIDSGTDLMVIPGNIDSALSAGCNKIIKEYPSTVVTKIEDIYEVYNFKNEKKIKEEKFHQLNLEEQLILSVIQEDEVHYDEILVKTQIASKILNVTLTNLQLKGLIRKIPGNTYELIK
ncbi:MAG: DNA-processing protein DprA, partial [Clostridia bacterium]|nr:DNA-processing protein DprA [Clostridia bacterium]